MNEPKLTTNMLERWNPTATYFEKQILAKSPLAAGAKNQVVLWGVSQGSLGIKDYAVTTCYLAKNSYDGCVEGDHDNFIEIWEYPVLNKASGDVVDIPKTVAVRFVIAVNLTLNTDEVAIYTTLLHEWYVHAIKWSGMLDYIRKGEALYAVPLIKGQTSKKREAAEHIEFANWQDSDVEQCVKQLGLDGSSSEKIMSRLKADRDRHDKTTGEVK